jgi:hypothetical protein
MIFEKIAHEFVNVFRLIQWSGNERPIWLGATLERQERPCWPWRKLGQKLLAAVLGCSE